MILGYARVSTAEQAQDDRTSLPEQENVISGYALTQGVDRFGVQVYRDEGVSASIPLAERPDGARLLADMREGDTVVAAKMDRIFRSARDALEIADLCKARGVHLVLVDMGLQPVTADNGVSRMFFTLLAAFAEFERGRIKERMVQGKTAKARKGGHIGGEAPYGYRIVGEGRAAVLEENPAEQEVVDYVRRKVFGANYSNSSVAADLNAAGYRNRVGKPFYPFQVQRITQRLTAN